MPSFVPPPSSASSSVDPVPYTPGEESEKDYSAIKVRTGRSESESSVSVAAGLGVATGEEKKASGTSGEELKRPSEGGGSAESEAPKKKRRVALTHLGDAE